MKTTRWIALLLCLVMCIPVVVACGDPTPPPPGNDTTAAPVDTASPEDTVPLDAYGREIIDSALPQDLTFEGTNINFFVRMDPEFIGELFCENSDGDIISNAIYERNIKVEEQLKVTMENVPTTGNYKQMHNVVSASSMAGDDDYQICAIHAGYSATGITSGLYMNLVDAPYLSFDKPWWNSDFNDKATLYNQLYFCLGDLATTGLTGIYITYVNKDMAEQFNVDVDELYTTVQNGDWTYDKLLELSTIYVDDGNGTRDENDKYGFIINSGTVIYPFTVCFDTRLLTIHDDNSVEVTVYTDKMVDIVEKVYYLAYEHEGTFFWSDNNYLNLAKNLYTNGNSLMMINKMGFASTHLKNTTFDKALLPFPKYDKSQEKYMSYSHNDHSVFSIPKTCVNVEAACATLELMNELSYKEVTPVIFEDALKIKYSADEVTASMLDIVRSGLSFDAGWIYSNTLGNLAQNTLSNLIANKSKDLASRYASIQATLDTKLTELVTYLEANQ